LFSASFRDVPWADGYGPFDFLTNIRNTHTHRFLAGHLCAVEARRFWPPGWVEADFLKKAAQHLLRAEGRLIPFNSNSPTGSTLTAFSTFVSTRGLKKI
jgi:hypothetical protein